MTTTIRGIPVALPPANAFQPEPMPSGDTADGLVLSLDPATGTVNWKRSHIACGPSALAENMALTGRQHNALIGPVGEFGMRGGLAAYVPRGVWNVQGHVVIAGQTNVEYVVFVWQGHAQSADPARPGIISDSPAIVGGGVQTWNGPAHMPFSIPFNAHLLQFVGAPGTANEITVTVYPKCDGSAGSALARVLPDHTGGGFLPDNFASSFMITRVRGV